MESANSILQEEHRRRAWVWPLFMAVWTVLVVAALWLLFRLSTQMASGPPVVVHAGDPAQISLAQKIREWLMLAHLNFARVYPWGFFAPYVLWFASKFALERERLKIHLPMLLAGCALLLRDTCHQLAGINSQNPGCSV